MKRFYQGLAALLMLIFVVQGGVFGQTNNLNVTTTAVPFLRISPDARAGGMRRRACQFRPSDDSPMR